MPVIGTYKHNIKAVGVASTDITLKTAVVPRGQIIEVTYASLSDYTSTNRKLIIAIRDVDNVDTKLKVEKTSSTFSTWLNDHPMLYEGECLVGIIENTNTDDELSFSVHGLRYRGFAGQVV